MENKIGLVSGWLRNIVNRQDAINTPVLSTDVVKIRQVLSDIVHDLSCEHKIICDHISKKMEYLFVYQMAGYVQFIMINPVVIGQVLECLDLLAVLTQNKRNSSYGLWEYIHPRIVGVSKKLYEDGHYSNAAEDAFIEINDRVKKLFKKLNPLENKVPDGDAVMTTVFSVNKPMIQLCDLSTETGINEQKGLMFMLQGAISALRNPKAHSNITISREDSFRRIMFASMLMYKIDEAVSYSQIEE